MTPTQGDQKVMLLTGGARGIGAATARLATRAGYRVVVNYRSRADTAESLVRALLTDGGKAVALQADVSREAEVMALFAKIDQRFGRLDALVNNAGILATQGPLTSMSGERLERVFATNILGSFLCAREAIRRMSPREGGQGGAIVNVSSAASRLGSPGEYVDYAASKAALDTFTIGLAKEVAADAIRVNAVRPGVIYTDIHASGGEPDRVDRVKSQVPMGRGGQPEEVARAILWLLSEEASYITGALIDISGGR